MFAAVNWLSLAGLAVGLVFAAFGAMNVVSLVRGEGNRYASVFYALIWLFFATVLVANNLLYVITAEA